MIKRLTEKTGGRGTGCIEEQGIQGTVEPQWLEHLWDHGNLFEIRVVRVTEG